MKSLNNFKIAGVQFTFSEVHDTNNLYDDKNIILNTMSGITELGKTQTESKNWSITMSDNKIQAYTGTENYLGNDKWEDLIYLKNKVTFDKNMSQEISYIIDSGNTTQGYLEFISSEELKLL